MIARKFTKRNVKEYVDSLKNSEKFGQQVVSHQVFEATEPSFSQSELNFSPTLHRSLIDIGISALYSHQADACIRIGKGENVMVATPTSSGKSLVYNLPVVESIIKNNDIHALYLFPLKALSQDQQKKLCDLSARIFSEERRTSTPLSAIYDGDTTPYNRRKIREQPPSILISNPEMLHLSLLPHHESWAHFFRKLHFIIIDEVHTYRGIFGSHFSWLIRRLKRVAAHYGADPTFILSSATIGNPQTFAEQIIDGQVTVIQDSGAPQSRKNFLFLNPYDSAAYCASQLLEASVKRKLRTIVYTQSRKMTELISMWTTPRLGDLSAKLSSYRAGFLPEERREIEAKLNSGDLIGVISTSALELGIDIGDLDICLLVGYPGSIMSSLQRGGRVGRGGHESAVILIASEDALDQYYMKNPQRFFSGGVESAVINPFNDTILINHLQCAAAEFPLQENEPLMRDTKTKSIAEKMLIGGQLLQSEDGEKFYSSRKRPQRYVNLRGGGDSLTIIDGDSGVIMGEIDAARALKECHEGAIYLHRMRTWYVVKLDLGEREVVVTEKNVPYFTRPMTTKDTEILKTIANTTVFGCRCFMGELRVTEKVTGYQKRNKGTNRLISTIPLDLPEQIMETTGVWFEVPRHIVENLEEKKHHFMGGLHALEHLLISVFPIIILCDRNDIGGISCPEHEQTETATIFIYDGHAGGSGLCYEAYRKSEELFNVSASIISDCECENGCPSCVHSPKCGSGNRPIDKLSCLCLLENIISGSVSPAPGKKSKRNAASYSRQHDKIKASSPSSLQLLPEHWGVFDLETKFSANEVGGWHRIEKMGLSVGVVYDSLLEGFVTYYEDEAERLIDHLMGLNLIVGFNNKRFDNKVLHPYGGQYLHEIPTIDLLEEVSNHLGYRLKLDSLAEQTLGRKKTGDGLQALQWYQMGDFENLSRYCREDVAITRDLFLYGVENGYFLFRNKAKAKVRLPLSLDKALAKLSVR